MSPTSANRDPESSSSKSRRTRPRRARRWSRSARPSKRRSPTCRRRTRSCFLEKQLLVLLRQIADMPEEDKKLFLEDLGMDEPGLNRVIRAAYQLLGLHTYFTAGPKEVHAW